MTETSNSLSSLYPRKQNNKVLIGGPGSLLPFWLEALLAWALAISCLGVALYHWLLQIILPNPTKSLIPLMTHSHQELNRLSGIERYQHLIQLMNMTKPVEEDWNDSELIEYIHSNHFARRLLSLVMILRYKQNQDNKNRPAGAMEFPLLDRFEMLWPKLVELPTLQVQQHYPFDISIVMTVYKENGRTLLKKLHLAQDLAYGNTDKIEVIIVNAGHCIHLEDVITDAKMTKFGRVQLVNGDGFGGRGPCLNLGATKAQGQILTFLHADTKLSFRWDIAILNGFADTSGKTVNSSAFSFAIDTPAYKVPGLQAVEYTANLRTKWFHLPYGDQCISISRIIFDHIGGYPHQCLMEDYEIVKLLRQRAAQLDERLVIMDTPAFCSPRRWQAFGVLYVTYTNSKCVTLYSRGDLTPDELFELYYGAKPPAGTHTPWEIELEGILQNRYPAQ